jgi:hypothetical protein
LRARERGGIGEIRGRNKNKEGKKEKKNLNGKSEKGQISEFRTSDRSWAYDADNLNVHNSVKIKKLTCCSKSIATVYYKFMATPQEDVSRKTSN